MPRSLFSLFSVWLFVTLVRRAQIFIAQFDCLLRSCLAHCFVCFVLLSVTLVSRVLFFLCSVWLFWLFVTLMSRALSFLCSVWLFTTFVSRALFFLCSVWLFVTLVPRAVFSVLCLIVCDVYVSCTVFFVCCMIGCYISVSRTFLFVFRLIVCYVSASSTVFSVFCSLRWCLAQFCLCSVWLFATLVPRALFLFFLFDHLFSWCLAHSFSCVHQRNK